MSAQLSQQEQEAIALAMAAKAAADAGVRGSGAFWPAEYRNADTGKTYSSHHEDEEQFVYSDSPRYLLARGGEGGGKSVAGIVKDLNRLRRGMTGIMVSPDFEHLKKSLWPEFRRWCPPSAVVEAERYRLAPTWEPSKPFALHFRAEARPTATLYVGGIEDPSGWEGPNVSFAHFDEARRHKTPAAVKVLDGRVRIVGPAGELPQLWLTTTPAKHWLFDYFGPEQESDPYLSFKRDAFSIKLLTKDNEAAGNLSEGFTRQRAQSLTESEARVLLEAEWEDADDVDRFLPGIAFWNNCKEKLPDLDAHTPVILGVDAGESNDTFATVMVSRHPSKPNCLAVRYVRGYAPKPGVPLDFDKIEADIRELCSKFAVRELTYDPMLLGQMIRRLKQNPKTVFQPFPQGAQRLEADKQLLDAVLQRQIAHDGNEELTRHVSNADKKVDGEGRRLRIVKRTYSLKIDLAVALSMACYRATELLDILSVHLTPDGVEQQSTWNL